MVRSSICSKIVDNILEGIIKADSKNENFYRQNAENYKEKLAELDKKNLSKLLVKLSTKPLYMEAILPLVILQSAMD